MKKIDKPLGDYRSRRLVTALPFCLMPFSQGLAEYRPKTACAIDKAATQLETDRLSSFPSMPTESPTSKETLLLYGAPAAALVFLLLLVVSRLTIRRLRREIKIHYQVERRLQDSEFNLKEGQASLEQSVAARTADFARSETQLRATLDNMPNVAIQWYDESGRVIYWNGASENLYGWQADETLGKSLDQLMPNTEQVAAFLDMLNNIRVSGGSIDSYESEFRHKTGRTGWLLSTMFTIPVADGQQGFVRMDVDVTERKQAELDLLQSREKYQRLVDDIGEKFIIFSHEPMKGEILYVSDGVRSMLGLAKEMVLGKVWYSLFQWLPDALSQAQTQVMRMAIGKSQFVQYEMEYVHPDGSVRTVQVSAHPVRDENGGVVTIDGIVEDITERKKTEHELERYRIHLEELVAERTKELRRQQAFTEAVLEHISDGIVVCDKQGLLSLFNRASLELHGIDLADLPPESWAEHYRLLQADGITPMTTDQVPLYRAFQGEIVHNQELVIEHAGGDKHIVLCSGQAMQDKDGQKIGAVISMHDITLQKKAEAELIQARDSAEAANRALQLNESRLNAMLNLSESAPQMSERDLLMHGMEEAERLTGSTIAYLHFLHADQQTIQLNLWSSNTYRYCTADYDQHFPVNLAGVWADAVRRKEAVVHNDYQNLTYRHGYPEHHAHLVRHMAVPILQDNQVKIIIGVGNKADDYDDADLRQVQLIGDSLWKIVSLRRSLKNLEAALDFAQAASRAKTVFLANMSHELRTPLNAILGFAQLLVRDPNIPEDKRQQVAIINRSGHHLLALINEILEVSRIEQGNIPVNHEVFALSKTLDSVEEMIRIRAMHKGLGFLAVHASDLPGFVKGDVKHLHQVLINLLGNAVKYTEQGRVRLSVTALPEQTVRFEISDTGPGIPEEELERIFQPFYQIKGSATKGEGTGLGLTISREFVRRMGGELMVESRLGTGSTFSFALPLPAADSALEAIAQKRVIGFAVGENPPRILLAEDHPDDRQALKQLLEQIGCEVSIAANGLEAIELFQARLPQLILMDVRLTETDAYDAIRQIRELPGGDLPIIALTDSLLAEDKVWLKTSGCNDMLSKPIEADSLFEMIGRMLQLKLEYAEVEDKAAEFSEFKEFEPALITLPPELREELATAAVALDIEATLAIVERIGNDYPAQADMITKLIEGFRFDEIIELSPKTKRNRDE